MKKAISFLFAAFFLLSLSGCEDLKIDTSSINDATSESSSSAVSKAEQPLTVGEQAEELISNMSLEEKVGQLFFVRCPETNAEDDIATYHLGGYILFGRDFKDLCANEIIRKLDSYQTEAKKDVGIPLLLGTDEEGGSVVRVSSNPKICKKTFKSPQQLFSDGNIEEVLADAHEKDTLLKALGINVNFAPVADVSTNSNDFIFARSFGKDGFETADYISNIISQMNTDGIGSVLKHFPGYGNNVDTHTGIATDKRPLKNFESSDFLPFRSGIDASDGKTAILVSHNIMSAVDSELPSSLSPAVHKILRGEMGFDGVVMTDDLTMDAVKAFSKDGNIAVLALQAGNDIVLTTDYKTQIPKTIEAVKNGTLKESVIDTACKRVIIFKMKLGILKDTK